MSKTREFEICLTFTVLGVLFLLLVFLGYLFFGALFK